MTTPERSLRGCGSLSPLYTQALAWAAAHHWEQLRKTTNVPYLAHLVSVSALVLEDGGTEVEAIAALLHDAVEDADGRGAEVAHEIKRMFGAAVASIVLECSDSIAVAGEDKKPWIERKRPYIEHLATGSLSAVRVSAADKTHNARSTVTDLHLEGAWPAFNACPHATVWYYDEISRIVTERLPESRTAYLLDQVVTQLFATVDGAARSVVALAEPPDCECVTP